VSVNTPSLTSAARHQPLLQGDRVLARFPERWATVGSVIAADVFGLLAVTGASMLLLRLGESGLMLLAPQAMIPVALLLICAFALAGLYQVGEIHPARELRLSALITGVVFGAYAAGVVAFTSGIPGTVLAVLTLALLALILIPLIRGLARVCLARCGWWGVPTVVFSTEEDTEEVLEMLQRWPELGLKPVGIVQPEVTTSSVRKVPIIGTDTSVLPKVRRMGVTHAVIASQGLTHRHLARRVHELRRLFPSVSVVPAGPDAPAVWTSSGSGWGTLDGCDRRKQTPTFADACKRVLDVVIATTALIVLAPLWLTISVLVRLDSSGPALFKQSRLGQHGEEFTL